MSMTISALLAVFVAVVCGNAGLACVFYMHTHEATTLINKTGMMRAFVRELQTIALLYGTGVESSDRKLPMLLRQMKRQSVQIGTIPGTKNAQMLVHGLEIYVTNFTTAVQEFYLHHNVTLYTSRPLTSLDVNGRYNFLLRIRAGDPHRWRPVIRMMDNQHAVFDRAYNDFNHMASSVVEHANKQNTILLALILISTLCALCVGATCVYVTRLHGNIIQVAATSEMKSDVYKSVLSNLNHELKGFIMRLRHVAEDALPEYENSILSKMMDHLTFALSTLSRRCDSSVAPRHVLVDLRHLAEVVRTMFPDIIVETDSASQLMGDPGYYYAIMHQMVRNARVHGKGQVVLKMSSRSLVVTNGPGMHHARLTALSNADALALCESGKVGTHTSSGQGLRDVQWVSNQIGAEFSLRFVPELVIATLLFCTSVTVHPEGPSEDSVASDASLPAAPRPPLALLVVDDDRIPRIQSKSILKKMAPEIALNGWDQGRHECVHNPRVLVLGHDEPNIADIIAWVRNAVAAGHMVVGLIDYFIEYSGGRVLLGTDVTSAVISACEDLPKDRVALYIRSGNDSIDDEQNYLRHGAHGMISKVLPISTLLEIVQRHVK